MTGPPDSTPEYMYPAWASCLMWAIGHDGCLDQFRQDTGTSWVPPANAIEIAIDAATGHGEDVAESFVEWFNVNVWGEL